MKNINLQAQQRVETVQSAQPEQQTPRLFDTLSADNEKLIEPAHPKPDYAMLLVILALINDLDQPSAPDSLKAKPKYVLQNSSTIILAKKRRLGHLEVQQARKGHDTPPHIMIEIEELREEIVALEGDR